MNFLDITKNGIISLLNMDISKEEINVNYIFQVHRVIKKERTIGESKIAYLTLTLSDSSFKYCGFILKVDKNEESSKINEGDIKKKIKEVNLR